MTVVCPIVGHVENDQGAEQMFACPVRCIAPLLLILIYADRNKEDQIFTRKVYRSRDF